jgi:hypothetical protein
MSPGKEIRQIAARGAVLIVTVLVLTVFLAAMPGHRVPIVDAQSEQQNSGASQPMQGMDHSKMQDMDSDEHATEKDAVSDMSMGHMHGSNAHMTMTAMRAQTPADAQKASEIVAQLKTGIEKYRDYHVALNEGYRIFMPNIPQPEYHFTSYKNGFLEAMRFDPSQPTSLLYKKTGDGYELVGAMYTMPKRATQDQLDQRVPTSIAMWHLHTNLCLPQLNQAKTADWTKFGLRGSIATQDACDAAGGRFRPVIFGWMVHVYPYETSLDKVFAMHHHD